MLDSFRFGWEERTRFRAWHTSSHGLTTTAVKTPRRWWQNHLGSMACSHYVAVTAGLDKVPPNPAHQSGCVICVFDALTMGN